MYNIRPTLILLNKNLQVGVPNVGMFSTLGYLDELNIRVQFG